MELKSFSEYSKISIKGKTALVTGASSGFGFDTACFLASVGVNLNLVARRENRLIELQNLLMEKYPELKINILAGDLTENSTFGQMSEKGFFDVDILINNAGGAFGRDNVENSLIEDWEQMININVTSAFKVVHKVLPYMKNKQEGDIICISSIAGHIPYEGGSVYCATKSAMNLFCNSLRLETCGTNIRVIIVSPGLAKTEFSEVRFKGDTNRANAVYDNVTPLSGTDIAYQITNALLLPRHVNLDEIIIMASAQGGPTKIVRNKV